MYIIDILKICLSCGAYSVSYQLLFLILGNQYSEYLTHGFMLTYWTQFVYLILVESLSSVVNLSLTARGQSKISSIASDYYKTAEVSCSIMLIVTFLLIGVSNDKFRSLFGIDDKYGPVMILSYVILVCMGIVFIISKDLIYEEKSKQSLIISISYNTIVVIISILAGYITDDEITGLVIIGGVNIAYTVVLLL